MTTTNLNRVRKWNLFAIIETTAKIARCIFNMTCNPNGTKFFKTVHPNGLLKLLHNDFFYLKDAA